jgi:hypothetical protein
MKSVMIRMLLVLALLLGAVAHPDSATAHVDEAAHSMQHHADEQQSDDDVPSPYDIAVHGSHHHCPIALSDAGPGLDCTCLSNAAALLADRGARIPPSRAIPPLPEPPTA